jgi:hypothetical protein
MNRTLHVGARLGPTDSPSEVYAVLAEGVPHDVLLALGPGVARELRQELHSWEAVARWQGDLARRLDRVVLLNTPERDGSSKTWIVAPPAWSQEGLAGYVAARHEELAAAFGRVERLFDPSSEAVA